MKKKNLNHRGLQLNKNVISIVGTEKVKGGNVSMFKDRNGNCIMSVTGCPFCSIPPSCVCPPSYNSCDSCPGENCTDPFN